MKISTKLSQKQKDSVTFSLEYYPPKTEKGLTNLYGRLDRMADLNPLFCDITWGAGGRTSDLTLEIATNIQKYCGMTAMSHLTCTNMKPQLFKDALEQCKKVGISNILALRGDPAQGQEEWTATEGGFKHASDLVTFIRKTYGDQFCIGVAGYSDSHSGDYENDLRWLKHKVDCGADLIITQMFYDVDHFLKFVKDCRKLGITIPIIPGIMPIQTYNGFKRMTGFCKTPVPEEITEALEKIKDDDEAVKKYGIKLAIQMCKRLVENGLTHLHFYTLNLEKAVTQIITGLGVLESSQRRSLPFRTSLDPRRQSEDVRPIFWRNRQKAYIRRTESWDDFPNGRWGNQNSPAAFGDLSLWQNLSGKWNPSTSSELISQWGSPKSEIDVRKIFCKYLNGDIQDFPWADSPLDKETATIREPLTALNCAGFLTINSQPAVNGVPSSDPTVGWGSRNGFIYQKAYLEFFCSPSLTQKLIKLIDSSPKYSSLCYHAITHTGVEISNTPKNTSTIAVTWGVFPNSEIVQPTVVSSESFMVWKDEAFDLFNSKWGSIYPPESESAKLLKVISDTYYLVNIVDNNYVNGNIYQIFTDLLGVSSLEELTTSCESQTSTVSSDTPTTKSTSVTVTV